MKTTFASSTASAIEGVKLKSLVSFKCLFNKPSIPGSKNSQVMVTKSIKNINKLTVIEKIEAAKKAKKVADKKKK